MTRRRHLSVGLGGALIAALVALLVWTQPPALPYYAEVRAAWVPSEAYLLDRNGRLLAETRVDFTVRRLAWTPLDAVSPALPRALIAAEDRRFEQHRGVDWLAVGGALRASLGGERSRGASTISMQLAALLSPELAADGSRRSLGQKLRQARAAMALERRWSKSQILEAYLNLLGYRGELQGIAAASRTLLGKAPSGLSEAESLTLAALLPSPSAPSHHVATRACRIARAVRSRLSCTRLGITATEMLSRSGIGGRPSSFASHLAARLLRAPGETVTTTLDAGVQRFVREALSRQLGHLSAQAARDGAAVVVDNATGDVLAYVGSAGASSRAAKVDGVRAYRQAGSTLKPFLYGLAIEKGYLTAASILDDSPVHLDTASGLYIPQNYDRVFRGPVSVRTALGNSLNVPAVRTLLLVGVDDLRDRLYDSGYQGIVEEGGFYGYSLALGSAEVTLLEQAAAYRALARSGLWSSLRLRRDDATGEERRILSPAAAYIVSDILSDAGARSLTFGLDSQLTLPFWAAVKTGTSKAMRDNWCVGFSDRYTVAVWVGNFEGDSMRGVSGISGAAPVWREIMLHLHADLPSRRPDRPAAVVMARARFAPAVEPARDELFVRGTEQPLFALVPTTARAPRIVNPVNGTIFALDPDIPPDRQRLHVRTIGTGPGMQLHLDGRRIGDADVAVLLSLTPGRHRLALTDSTGAVADLSTFIVR